MSRKFVFALAALGVALTSAPAFAYDRYFDFRETWGNSVEKHRRDDALSATPRDVTRRQTPNVYRPGAHDPSGNIILEGAM